MSRRFASFSRSTPPNNHPKEPHETRLQSHPATQQPVKVGDKVKIASNEFSVLDFLPPHKPDAQGKVAVGYPGESGTLFYVSVIGAEWIEREDRPNTTAKDDTLAALAARLGFASLVTSKTGADFKEVSVWSVREALEAAYEAGRQSAAAAVPVAEPAEQFDILLTAINRLLASCSETEKLTDEILVSAMSDPEASPIVREQAASVLQARQAVRAVQP